MGLAWFLTSMVEDAGGPARLPGGGEDHVLVHLELSAEALGTDPPPSRSHIRAYQVPSGWVLLLWAPQGPTDAIRAWAKAQAPSEEIGFGEVGERIVALQCETLPPAWETLFGLFDAHHLIMGPGGSAMTRIEGSRDEVGEFLGGLELEVKPESVEVVPAAGDRIRDDVLTPRQEHALARAAALGYFDIPRRIHLDELAERLGTSSSALSELLRRAQARLVTKYLDNQLGGLEAVLDLDDPSL